MWLVIGLFVVGVVLILSEFFIPGGVLGLLGGILVITSIGVGWYRFPDQGVLILVGELTGVALVICLGLYLILKTPLGGGFILKTNQMVEEGYADYSLEDENLVGTTAIVHNPLRPAGSIMIGERRIDAVSDGTYIDKGSTVRIVEVEGHRVVCEKIEAPAEEAAEESA